MVLKKDQATRLGETYFHENTVADKSLTFFLQPVLDRISLALPSWLSPNVITLSAGCLIVFSSLVLFLHIPKLYGPVSPWVCILCVIGVLGFVVRFSLLPPSSLVHPEGYSLHSIPSAFFCLFFLFLMVPWYHAKI